MMELNENQINEFAKIAIAFSFVAVLTELRGESNITMFVISSLTYFTYYFIFLTNFMTGNSNKNLTNKAFKLIYLFSGIFFPLIISVKSLEVVGPIQQIAIYAMAGVIYFGLGNNIVEDIKNLHAL